MNEEKTFSIFCIKPLDLMDSLGRQRIYQIVDTRNVFELKRGTVCWYRDGYTEIEANKLAASFREIEITSTREDILVIEMQMRKKPIEIRRTK
jgi:hypothetical protein